MCRSIILSSKITSNVAQSPISQRNKATKKAAEVEIQEGEYRQHLKMEGYAI